jgi:hypothetical protein
MEVVAASIKITACRRAFHNKVRVAQLARNLSPYRYIYGI